MTPTPKFTTKTERTHSALYADALRMIEFDVLNHVARTKMIPEDWHDIARFPSDKKTRITICIDADVVKFFRTMGPRYQPRINRVLSAWVHGRLARMIGGPDVTDMIGQGETLGINERARPTWGEMADMWEEQRAELAKMSLDKELGRLEAEAMAMEAVKARKAAAEE